VNRRSLFATKSLEHIVGEEGTGLKRSLGALDLTLLGVGCIMGTGIFVLAGQAAAVHAGPSVVLSFILAALCAAFGAMCYAEMASMLPVAGSAYVYAYATMGELAAMLIGWNLVLQYLGGAATVSVGWSGYVGALFHHLGLPYVSESLSHSPLAWDAASNTLVATGAVMNLPAAGIIMAICGVLTRGVTESSRLNAVIVFIKMAVVLLFIGFALPHVDSKNWQPFIPGNTGHFGQFGLSGIFQGASILFFSYLGFDAVSVAAGETKNPQRDVPIGLIASLGICAVLYMAVAAALTGLVPYTQLGVPYPMALGVAAIGMGWLELLVEVGAIAGLSSVLLVQLYAASRIVLAMAKDGFFPQALTGTPQNGEAPKRLIWQAGIVCALAAAFFPIDVLAELTSLGTLFVFATVGFAVAVLRVRAPQWPRKFRVPGGDFFIPGLCVSTSLILMATAQGATVMRLGVYMALGLLIYFGYSRGRITALTPGQTGSPSTGTPPVLK
jgi:APA family basic amino acid/polyamine antiporter